MPEPSPPAPDDLIRRVEGLLRARFGPRLGVAGQIDLPGAQRYRANLYRLSLEASSDAPATVIVKQTRLTEDGGDSSAARFRSEHAALEVLSRIDARPPVAPYLWAADHEQRLLIMEDLGDGDSLASLLLEGSRESAEAALLAYSRTLGRMHALTSSRREGPHLANLFGKPQWATQDAHWLDRVLNGLPDAARDLAIHWAPAMMAELERVRAMILTPGAFNALAHCDPCPDNNRLLADGELRLFDFEFAHFRHALLDGGYTDVPFPTCWCVNSLPPELLPSLEHAYRSELSKGVPEAEDDAIFHEALVEAAAFWLAYTTTYNGTFKRSLDEDSSWGISTMRQRVVHRAELFSLLAARHHHLEALGSCAQELATALSDRWSDLEEMPLYPAFRPRQ